MECKCETCVRKDCADRTKQDDLRIVINCYDYLNMERQMTNADRIRDTDEELATMLHAVKMGYAPWCDYHCENEGDDGCDNCIKKWLQQPAEGDA